MRNKKFLLFATLALTPALLAGCHKETPVYTATFYDWDATLLATVSVKQGEAAVYSGATPMRAHDNAYSYTFNGWDHALENVQGDTLYRALYQKTAYTPEVVKYNVTFLNYDNSVLATTIVEAGKKASYGAATPVRNNDADYSYTFKGWDKDLATYLINENTTFTAQYTATKLEKIYDVNFFDWDGTHLDIQHIKEGEKAQALATTPVRADDADYSYTFSTWSIDLNEPITANVNVYAQYTKTPITHLYTVAFRNWDGTLVATSHVTQGEKITMIPADPTRPSSDDKNYVFNGWGVDFATYVVTGNVELWAQYGSTARKYTARWLDYNGQILGSREVAYGEQVGDFTGDAPARDSEPDGFYQFSGWDDDPAYHIMTTDYDFHAVYNRVAYDYAFKFTEIGGSYSIDGIISDNYPAITDWEIPATHAGENVTAISASAFSGETSHIKAMVIPEGIDTIGDKAFQNTDITAFDIPSTVTTLGKDVLDGCTGVETITSSSAGYEADLYNGATVIDTLSREIVLVAPGAAAVNISDTITGIANNLISGMPKLTTLNILSTTLTVSGLNVQWNFDDDPLFTTVTTPTDSGYTGDLVAGDGVLFSKANVSLVLIPQGKTGDYVIPTNIPTTTTPVTKIEEFAGYNSTLNSVTIGGAITSVGNSAFYGSTLTNLYFGTASAASQNVVFGSRVFAYCPKLVSVTMAKDATVHATSYTFGEGAFSDDDVLTTIEVKITGTAYAYLHFGKTALSGCTALVNLDLFTGYLEGDSVFKNDTALTTIRINPNQFSTYNLIFEGCTGLTNLVLTGTIKDLNVRNSTFFDCKALKYVFLASGDTKATLSTVSYGNGNSYFQNATYCVYSETQPTDTTVTYWHMVNGVPTIWVVA